MRTSFKIVAGALISSLVLGFCMGNTGCQKSGSSGGGGLIAVGNVPVPVAVPYGTSVRGPTKGLSIWVLRGAAAAIAGSAALAAAQSKALRLVGGTSVGLATTGDPCKNRDDKVRIQNWRHNGKFIYFDCGNWKDLKRRLKDITHGGSAQKRLQMALRCIQNVINLGFYSTKSYGTLISWSGINNKTASVIFGSNGRIISAQAEAWGTCASMGSK
jgi:hypothetical protein